MTHAEMLRRRRKGQSYAAIALDAGVSRQRVYQIIQMYVDIQTGTYRAPDRTCPLCGESWMSRKPVTYRCPKCHRRIQVGETQ